MRCVSDKAWVTRRRDGRVRHCPRSLGRHEQAADLLAWVGRHRCPDGSYLTGLVYPQESSFPPEERSSYTAAAMVLA